MMDGLVMDDKSSGCGIYNARITNNELQESVESRNITTNCVTTPNKRKANVCYCILKEGVEFPARI